MGLNAHDCHGPNWTPCTAEELTRFGTVAVGHPYNCAFLSWRYDEPTWQRRRRPRRVGRLAGAGPGPPRGGLPPQLSFH